MFYIQLILKKCSRIKLDTENTIEVKTNFQILLNCFLNKVELIEITTNCNDLISNLPFELYLQAYKPRILK